MKTIVIILSLLVLSIAAMADPPDGADPFFAPWFKSLTKETGESCCSIADCRPVNARISAEGYQVNIEGNWLPVPAEIILHRDNPIGEPILCMRNSKFECFIPASET